MKKPLRLSKLHAAAVFLLLLIVVSSKPAIAIHSVLNNCA